MDPRKREGLGELQQNAGSLLCVQMWSLAREKRHALGTQEQGKEGNRDTASGGWGEA